MNKNNQNFCDLNLVNRHRKIVRRAGLFSLLTSFLLVINVLIIDRHLAFSGMAQHFRGFIHYFTFALNVLFIIDWTYLKNQQFCVQYHNEPKVLSHLKWSQSVSIFVITAQSLHKVVYHTLMLSKLRLWSFDLKMVQIIGVRYLSSFFALTADIGYLYFFNLIYRGINLLHADMICFNQQAIDLRDSNRLTIQKIFKLRQFYSKAIRNIQNLEKFAKFEIGRLYINFVIFYIFTAIEIFGTDSERRTNYDLISLLLVDSMILICLTIKAIMLHLVCHQEPETIYELTNPITNEKFRDEASLLYYRLTKRDVGLTFLGLFTLTPRFALSMLTLKFTIFMAIPNFLPFIRSKNMDLS